MKPVTLAITYFERMPLLLECFAQVLDDPRIKEIVIVDDCSQDGSYQLLRAKFRCHPKVYLFSNDRNVDCYENKFRALQHASGAWVILFDSDNVIDKSYLDAIERLGELKSDHFYLPEFAKPNFDYRDFTGLWINRENVSSFMGQPSFATMLNTANYLVPREGYMRVWDGKVNPHTADSIYQAYNWIREGGGLHVVRGMQYFHRVHEGSHYKKNHHKTGGFARSVEGKLKQLK